MIMKHTKHLITWLLFQQATVYCTASTAVLMTQKRPSLESNPHLHDMDHVPLDCVDEYSQCTTWARAGYCRASFSSRVRSVCRKSCPNACNDGSIDLGVPQVMPHGNHEAVRRVVAETLDYLYTQVHADSDYEFVRDKCVNSDESCAYWKSVGECENNAQYMLEQCGASCLNCFDLDVMLRCPWDPTVPLAMEPGGIHKMFERITNPESQWNELYEISILSQPSNNDENRDGPWIITLDNFLNDTECDALIEMGTALGYERSTAQAVDSSETGLFEAEVTDYRTSQQAWCYDECHESPITVGIMERIGNLTGVPERYSEHLQLLRYEENQYYHEHHDFIDMQNQRPMGPRLLTVFMYLNDEGLEGGGTRFTELDLTVMPKKGRALIWPSVMNDDLMKIDRRTEHEALVVESGNKFGANAWIHLGDFKDADERDCVF